MRRPRFSNDVCIEEGINLMVIRTKRHTKSIGLICLLPAVSKPVCYDVVRIHGFCGDIVFACCWDRCPSGPMIFALALISVRGSKVVQGLIKHSGLFSTILYRYFLLSPNRSTTTPALGLLKVIFIFISFLRPVFQKRSCSEWYTQWWAICQAWSCFTNSIIICELHQYKKEALKHCEEHQAFIVYHHIAVHGRKQKESAIFSIAMGTILR